MNNIKMLFLFFGQVRPFLACSVLLSATTCVADVSGLYPVVTSYDVERTASTMKITTYSTLVPVTISDEEADRDMLCMDVCLNAWAYLEFRNGTYRMWSNGYSNTPFPNLPSSYRTYRPILEYFQKEFAAYSTFSSTATIETSESTGVPLCMVYAGYDRGKMNRPSPLGGVTELSGDQGCVKLPPSNESCSLVTSAIDFNFGTLNISKSNGASISKTVSLNCSAELNYKLQLISAATGNAISLTNGMLATFTAGGLDLGSTLSGKQGSNNVELKATLSGTPSGTGAFTGTDVLIISYP
ncbi:hypothetical protein [Enterobacter ludwigii]|uniref:hypothetical protein n=1 Tax=Enterobacter ludwigii TaxID=299767 RepID=UPI00397538B5